MVRFVSSGQRFVHYRVEGPLRKPAEAVRTAQAPSSTKMGRLRFELRTNRLKAECSTAELATRPDGQP